MEQINYFHKGVVSDLDYSKVPSDRWVFPTHNVRIVRKDGYGFVATSMDGTSELFSLNDTYYPLAAADHNGILFILSYNGVTVEIGSYPSIDQLANTGFERQYRPLYNIMNNGTRQPFNLSIFGYDSNSYVEMETREDVDGTVNLYLCDGENPDYVVNSGFTISGSYIDRYYTQANVRKLTYRFLTESEPPTLDSFTIDNYGKLYYGNYQVYVRYLDAQYNRTPYLVYFGPFQISKGGNVITLEGGKYNIESNKSMTLNLSGLDTSFKFVEIGLCHCGGDNSAIVKTYSSIVKKYEIINSSLQITISGYEDLAIETEADFLYVPEGYVSSSHVQHYSTLWDLNIKGAEYDKTIFAEFAKRIRVDFDSTVEFSDEVLYGMRYDNNVEVKDSLPANYGPDGWYGTKGMTDNAVVATTNPEESKDGYRSYPDAYSSVGYFRGEIYPFAVVGKLVDGTYTEAFPICGFDAISADTANTGYKTSVDSIGRYLMPSGLPSGANNKGLYRFPLYSTHWDVLGGDKPRINMNWVVLGAKFTLTDANTYLAGVGGLENITELIFVRGERVRNLLYQGLALPCCTYDLDGWPDKIFPFDEPKIPITAHFTVDWAGITPPQSRIDKDSMLNGDIIIDPSVSNANEGYLAIYGADTNPATAGNLIDGFEVCEDKMALISFDNFLEPTPATWKVNDCYMVELYTYGWSNKDIALPPIEWSGIAYGTDNAKNCHYHGYARDYTIVNDDTLEYMGCDIESVEDYNASGSLFASFAEHGMEMSDPFIYIPDFDPITSQGNQPEDLKIYNRTMHTGRYIGINLHASRSMGNLIRRRSIVAIYKNHNDAAFFQSVLSSFSPSSNTYTQIGLPTSVYSLPTIYQAWNGDCYLQRGYRRIMHWHSKAPEAVYMYDAKADGTSIENYPSGDEVAFRYEHGFTLGFVSECSKNIAMRYSDNTKTFFPVAATLPGGGMHHFTMAGEEDVYIDESNFYNSGYHQNTGIRGFFGADTGITVNRRRWPTRLRYSDTHLIGGISDAYRIIRDTNKQDFHLEFGDGKRVAMYLSSMILVMENAVIEPQINTKGIKVPTSEGEAILGAGNILEREAIVLQNSGTQHPQSVYSVATGIVGVDSRKRVVWKIAPKASGMTTRLAGMDMAQMSGITSQIEAIFDSFNTGFDVVGHHPNTPNNGYGIVTGYDEKNMEIFFTFIKADQEMDYSTTLYFSEMIDAFIGTVEFKPSFYTSLGGRMIFGGYEANTRALASDMHLHLDGMPLRFQNVLGGFKISIIVNGQVSERENLTAITKQFFSYLVETNYEWLYKAYYETEHQTSEQDLSATAPFYSLPEYSENKWSIPIDVQLSGDQVDMNAGSGMRGRWIKITIEYTGDGFIFVKNIQTKFIPSFS